MNNIETVREFYNNGVEDEWERLKRHSFEFEITKHYLDSYIRPGDRVLDIGGGPGRYSLYLAEKGCDVMLYDLSEGNVAFALGKAKEAGVKLTGIAGDARTVDEAVTGKFDHILLMGPMYHLLEETDRKKCVDSTLKLLADGGTIFISFISLYAGMCYAMKYMPSLVVDQNESEYLDCYMRDNTYCGDAFTKACLITPNEIIPFMEQFPLQKLHLFGQEGITAPCENILLAQPEDVIRKWIDISIEISERADSIAFSEHLMYVGRKI